jgi:2-phosphosulfolactate phosphatase
VKRVRVVLAGPQAPDADSSRDLYGAPPPLPAISPPADAPRGEDVAVAIDVLRATTTLSVALANGAAGVVAAGTVEEGFALRRRHPDGLLCGERDGRIVPGFDLGNSPLEYTSERVKGRLLLFASTNGSQALRFSAGARRRLVGAFLNARAVTECVASADTVWLVAAGKLGQFALEDAACAGWIARDLAARGFTLDGEAARFAASLSPRDARGVRALLDGCSHGRYLRSLGGAFAADVGYCAQLDTLDRAFEV